MIDFKFSNFQALKEPFHILLRTFKFLSFSLEKYGVVFIFSSCSWIKAATLTLKILLRHWASKVCHVILYFLKVFVSCVHNGWIDTINSTEIFFIWLILKKFKIKKLVNKFFFPLLFVHGYDCHRNNKECRSNFSSWRHDFNGGWRGMEF